MWVQVLVRRKNDQAGRQASRQAGRRAGRAGEFVTSVWPPAWRLVPRRVCVVELVRRNDHSTWALIAGSFLDPRAGDDKTIWEGSPDAITRIFLPLSIGTERSTSTTATRLVGNRSRRADLGIVSGLRLLIFDWA